MAWLAWGKKVWDGFSIRTVQLQNPGGIIGLPTSLIFGSCRPLQLEVQCCIWDPRSILLWKSEGHHFSNYAVAALSTDCADRPTTKDKPPSVAAAATCAAGQYEPTACRYRDSPERLGQRLLALQPPPEHPDSKQQQQQQEACIEILQPNLCPSQCDSPAILAPQGGLLPFQWLSAGIRRRARLESVGLDRS